MFFVCFDGGSVNDCVFSIIGTNISWFPDKFSLNCEWINVCVGVIERFIQIRLFLKTFSNIQESF